MGLLLISTNADGYFRFKLQAANGKVVLTSRYFKLKQHCLKNAVHALRYGIFHQCYRKKISREGKYYFSLVALNGKPICVGQLHESRAACEASLAAVISAAMGAEMYMQVM